jgi:hypothetical protein
MKFKKYILISIIILISAQFVKAGSAQEEYSFVETAIPESIEQSQITADTTEKRFVPPLKSAAQNGLGPLSLPYLRNTLVGSANVSNSERPDLFVFGNTRSSDLYLLEWLKNNENGVPVFGSPIPISESFSSEGTVFQTDDGIIHGLWLEEDRVIHTIFDKDDNSFSKKGEVTLPELPSSAESISAFPDEDGGIELVFELEGFRMPRNNNSSDEWGPYDAAGISTNNFEYTYLYSIHYPKLLAGEAQQVQQATSTNKEVLFGMMNTTPVHFGEGHANGLMTGSHLGTFSYYQRINEKNSGFSDRRYMVGEDGNILRHPSVSASVSAYPRSKGNITDIIAGGEGAVYYYQFSGEFTDDGDPIFNDPVPVLQQNADLYAGTLPAPSTSDWDGDGVLDLIVGNSEGFVLFFKNTGDHANPAFLAGKRIKAGGREIQIQAGYSGSIQGTPEARWGYISPTVVDWTGDGLPDIIMGDITGNYTIYINKGTKTNPRLESARPLYSDGLPLHGMWRSRAAVGKFGGRLGMAIIDGDDNFHFYWKIDDYNVEDAGKLMLDNGSEIITSADPGGGTGRCKLSFFDYDGDGKLDLIIGNGRRSAIPNMETGYPLPILGQRTLGTPLFMRNTGSDAKPVFEHPSPFHLEGVGLLQPGGSHESGAIGTVLGGGEQKNLLVANEVGRLYLLPGDQLRLMSIEEAKEYRNEPNPLKEAASQESEPSEKEDTADHKPAEPTQAEVPYGSHERQVLDFYKADSDEPTPLVLWMHAGGWVSGSKKNVHALEDYLTAGISVVSINYRYTWQAQLAGIEPPVKWPLDDAARALQFVRSKAQEWNIDKKRIALSGSSAGASSSLYLAFGDDMADPNSSDPIARESTRPYTAAVRHPQTSLDPKQLVEWTPNSRYGGHAFGFMDPNDLSTRDAQFDEFLDNRESLLKWIKKYSPYELVSKDDPDVYLMYLSDPSVGEPQEDPTHTANYGVKLKEKCDKKGIDCELVYPGASDVKHESMEKYLIEKLTNSSL